MIYIFFDSRYFSPFSSFLEEKKKRAIHFHLVKDMKRVEEKKIYTNKDTNKNTDSLLKKVQKNYVGKQTLIVKNTK